jgi:hypothetical protein
MTRRTLQTLGLSITAFGFLLRLVALIRVQPNHPDEFFQYLEPAWRRISGAGIITWEWREGLRSWVLPGYLGAWMRALAWLGLRGSALGLALRVHWVVVSLLLVWAGWRGGAMIARAESIESPRAAPSDDAGVVGGILGAALCAGFPLLVTFSTDMLTELPSTIGVVWALVITGELVGQGPTASKRSAAAIGSLLGLGLGLRVQHAPAALVVGLCLLAARRYRALGIAFVTGALTLGLFGVVDWFTWGGIFSSYIGYVNFNLVQGGAAQFGVEPWYWYGVRYSNRLPNMLAVLLIVPIVGIRSTWPFVLTATSLLSLLSTQPHKEERFALLCWPLLLIAWAGVVGAWLAPRLRSGGPQRPISVGRQIERGSWLLACVGLGAGILVDGALHFQGTEFNLPLARYEAQGWVGRQADASGLLYDDLLGGGGYLWLGRTFPQVEFNSSLLDNPIFTHALVERGSNHEQLAKSAHFVEVYSKGDFVVLRRASRL